MNPINCKGRFDAAIKTKSEALEKSLAKSIFTFKFLHLFSNFSSSVKFSFVGEIKIDKYSIEGQFS